MGSWVSFNAWLALTPEVEKYGWALAVVGIVMVTLSMILGIRKKRRAAAGKVTARENLERFKAKGEMRDDLERVMVEVEQMAKRVATQLDAKAIAVEKLLEEADAKIARLEAATAGQPQPPPAADASPAPAASPGNGQPEPEGLSRDVYRLADQGLAPADIARQLDEHVGKVELILALRRA